MGSSWVSCTSIVGVEASDRLGADAAFQARGFYVRWRPTVATPGEIRRQLGSVVEPQAFDTLAGVVGGTRQIDHDRVLRLRRAHPDETPEQLGRRLGCSQVTPVVVAGAVVQRRAA